MFDMSYSNDFDLSQKVQQGKYVHFIINMPNHLLYNINYLITQIWNSKLNLSCPVLTFSLKGVRQFLPTWSTLVNAAKIK